ncbi:MAG TPA: DUF4956 domain-containing protein [Pyrinomonadaceae bacterium]|nr:DUF4956 domain-containing protein [Pyrinomonadaceae bacterium]
MKLDLKNQTLRLTVVFVVVLIASALLVYALLRGTANEPAQTRSVPVPAAEPSGTRPTIEEPVREPPRTSGNENQSFAGKLFESRSAETTSASESWATTVVRIALRLMLAAALGAALAFRPRKRSFGLRRNPYVAQTQILLAIVASALMMIVGDNAARAFGIFAAVSLVRFRTNIRDPKEISVLLISLALGLATGVGRPDLALILCVFALLVLWILETFEARQVFRLMALKVETKDVEATQSALKKVFSSHGFTSELRAVARSDENQAGTVVNAVDLSPLATTDSLSEEILSLDGGNITSIEWEQKKSSSYLYQ